MIAKFVTLVTLMFMLPSAIGAQQDPPTGERVRVTRLDGTVVTGTLESASLDLPDLVVLHGDSTFAIPRIEIEGVQRSLGRGPGFLKGFGATVLATALGGGALFALRWSPCTDWCFWYPNSRGDAFHWGAAIGGAVGVPIGLIAGLITRSERWEALTLDDPSGVELSVQPLGLGSLGVTGRIRFGPR